MIIDRAITNVLSTGLDLYNCFICFFMILMILPSLRKVPANKNLVLICIGLIIFNISDMANWLCEGTKRIWFPPYLRIMTFIYYSMPGILFVLMIKYIEEYLTTKIISPKYFKIAASLFLVYFVFVILTPFTGLIYTFTPDNYYQRGKYNFISVIFFLIFAIFVLWIIIRNRYSFTRPEFVTFLTYPIFPLFTEFLQLKFYGLGLVNLGMTLSVLSIFMNLHNNLVSSIVKKEGEVKSKEAKMLQFQEHTIISLSNLVENRDTETGEHARRTSLFVELLARQAMKDGYYLNTINEDYIQRLVKAAPMHDIGKIVVSDTVLKKPSRLDSQEFEQMKHHALEGGRIVSDIIGLTDDKEYVQIAVDMAQSHHERWDGMGYPNHLANEQIPLSARLMAIADVFDALVFERCYRKSIPISEAFSIIESEAGTHFDPILVNEFLKIKDELTRIVHIYRD